MRFIRKSRWEDVMRVLAIILAILAYLFAAVEAAAAQDIANLVRPELIADTTAIQPGKPFTVGLHLEIADGWHVYWKNPGDAGAPTTLKLTVPPGFTVGAIQYPVPERITLPGNLTIYAYEKELLLTATVTPPEDINNSPTIPIDGTAGWCVCDPERCIMKNMQLHLTLPTGHATPAATDLFATWKTRFPISARQAFSRPVEATNLDQSAQSRFLGYLTFTWRTPPATKNIQWLPFNSDEFNFTTGKVRTTGNVTSADLTAIPVPGNSNSPAADTSTSTTIDGVLAYYVDEQPPRGVLVHLDHRTMRLAANAMQIAPPILAGPSTQPQLGSIR